MNKIPWPGDHPLHRQPVAHVRSRQHAERRRGEKIRAKGIYRDAVRSSHSHFVKGSGLRRLLLSRITPVPWSQRRWALPVMTALAPSERYHRECGRRHKKLTGWARQILLVVGRWLPE